MTQINANGVGINAVARVSADQFDYSMQMSTWVRADFETEPLSQGNDRPRRSPLIGCSRCLDGSDSCYHSPYQGGAQPGARFMVMSGMSVMPLCLSLAGDCEPLPEIVQNMGGGEVGVALGGFRVILQPCNATTGIPFLWLSRCVPRGRGVFIFQLKPISNIPPFPQHSVNKQLCRESC